MFQLSVDMRNAELDALETTLGIDPIFRLFTGNQPADCSVVSSGTLLAEFVMPNDWMEPASGGTKMMLGNWQSLGITTTGFVGYYRIYERTGNRCKAQGPVCQAWFPSTSFIAGQRLAYGPSIYLCTTPGITDPASGPSGTGTGIVNGTAIFDYVTDVRGMVLVDDTNFRVGEPFTTRSYAWTAGNP
jgi:hypothetical protein